MSPSGPRLDQVVNTQLEHRLRVVEAKHQTLRLFGWLVQAGQLGDHAAYIDAAVPFAEEHRGSQSQDMWVVLRGEFVAAPIEASHRPRQLWAWEHVKSTLGVQTDPSPPSFEARSRRKRAT